MLDQVMLVFEPSSFEPEEFFKGSGQGQDPVGVEPSELEVLSRIDRVESNHDYCQYRFEPLVKLLLQWF